MKLTALLLTIICINVSAHGYSQTISISGKNIPLKVVFTSIERQTGLSFFYNYSLIKDIKLSIFEVKDVSLEDALNQALYGHDLEYYRSGKTIFIVKKRATSVIGDSQMSKLPEALLPHVRGIVINQEGEPLPSATVSVKNKNNVTLTDEKGAFDLKNVEIGAILRISYLGYEGKEIEVEGSSTMHVVMMAAQNKLDEAEVIAYGKTTERMSTGNVATVKANDISKQPIDNPLLALEGRVPGLFITQSNGIPGSGVIANIQGQNSITQGNDPLYVIDGVPYAAELLPNLGSIWGLSSTNGRATSGNPLTYINPGDIESISILKDADATAIYGSRAANGAILITTKKGKPGRTKLDINLQQGLGTNTRRLGLLNTNQYLAMRHEAKANDNAAVLASDYDINGFWDTTRHTDWQKTLVGQTAQYNNFAANLSGGNTNTQFLIGATWHRETTAFLGNFQDQKGAVHFNINSISSDQKFNFQFSGNYLVDDNELPNTDNTLVSLIRAPDAPALYNSDGTLNWMPNSSGVSTWTNPMAASNNKFVDKTKNLITNLVINYQLFRGLNIRSNFGYTNLQSNQTAIFPLSAIKPELRSSTSRSANYCNNTIGSWIIEPQIAYDYGIAKGKLEILVGTTIERDNDNGLQLVGIGYNSDLVLPDIHSAATTIVTSNIISEYKYNAAFSRVNFNWANKYILNLTGRRDGSSRFGSANEFHDFYAIGGSWLFSNEGLIRKTFSFLSFGKLRASYGTTGNDQIGDYQFLNLYTAINNAGTAYQGISSIVPRGLSNPYLEWEETRKLEIGADLGFFKDKVLLHGNYFKNRSSNELLPYNLPITTGFPNITKNLPATVQNTGLELTLTSSNLKERDLEWTSSVNFTIYENKLVAYPNFATSSLSSTYVIGKPVTIYRVYKYFGMDADSGVYLFTNSHGNATFSPNGITDKTVVINVAPKFYGGLENSLRYKGVELDFLFQFVKKDGLLSFYNTLPGFVGYNQPTTVLNRWRKPGDITDIQKFTTSTSNGAYQGYINVAASNLAYGDASYIRLKNVSLAWELPKSWVKGARMDDLRIYIQGQNLLTFTKYKGLDPETGSSSLPPLRMVTWGIRAAFNS